MADRNNAKTRRVIRPASCAIEGEGRILLMLDMPGVTKEGLAIEVKDNELTIIGRRQQPRLEGTWLVKERVDADFEAGYTIDDTIDPHKIEAALDAGVLTVTLNLKEAVKPRRITVKTG